jgi:transposase
VNAERLLKRIVQYKPKGRQRQGRPWVTWNVFVTSEEALTAYTMRHVDKMKHEFDAKYKKPTITYICSVDVSKLA